MTVGTRAASASFAGETPPLKKRPRIACPAGLGALAMTVNPPPVTAPATTATNKSIPNTLQPELPSCPNDMISIDWNPSSLLIGDHAGLLVTPQGDMCIFINGSKVVHLRESAVPTGANLYAVVDLLGSTSAVSLVPNAVPPALVQFVVSDHRVRSEGSTRAPADVLCWVTASPAC